MSAGARLQARRLARWVRRAPGYPQISHALLTRVRSNELAVDVIGRLIGDSHALGGGLNPLATTRDLEAGSSTGLVGTWPVVAVVVEPMGPEVTGRLVAHLVELQRRLGGFRPLLILAGAETAAARAAGLPFEILPPGPAEGAPGYQEWRVVRARRLVSITDHYGTWLLLEAHGDRLRTEDLELLEVLPGYLEVQARRREDDLRRPL